MPELRDQLQLTLGSSYSIERELGGGGMSRVFVAEDRQLGRPVVVKVLPPELAAGLNAERFRREIQLAARLQHPHIVPLLSAGSSGGMLYYTMPLIEGESLRARLARDGRLSIRDATRVLRDLADALAYAHAQGVVHRDIKPDNVLVSGHHALLSDFGVARAVTSATEEAALTSAGVALGTPAYMAPEQVAADPCVDHRADIYAFGALAYELLTGRPPFIGSTPREVLAAHIAAPPDLVTKHRDSVPPELARLVMRCLEKNPCDRWQAAEELLAELEGLAAPSGDVAPTRTTRLKRRSWQVALSGVAAAVVGGVILTLGPGGSPPAPPRPLYERTAIAVLPFDNLSAEGPHAYFAGGVHDELQTQLSKVAALKVISRTSVRAYAAAGTPLAQIARELKVGSLVEGSVQVAGGRLRVNVALVDAATGAQLWADQYDRPVDDAFAIQSDVAQKIVAAVGATLTRTERQGLTEAPTANADAYRLYLQGRQYVTRPGYTRQNIEIAQQLFERALALDPDFALARAALSEVHGRMHWYRHDPSPARAARQLNEAEAALRLAPDLPQAHVAMGLAHFWGRYDYGRALEEFRVALDGLPNDAEVWSWIGYVHRRRGSWDEALAAFDKAAQLNPRDANLFFNLGGTTLLALHRYADAVRAFDNALSLAPDHHGAAAWKAWTYIRWQGQLDTLRAVLNRMPGDAKPAGLGTRAAQHVQLLHWERQADSGLQVLASARIGVFESSFFFLPGSLHAAWLHQLRGDRRAAGAAFDSARVLLDSVARTLPDDWRVRAARGLALAGLGHRDEALREAHSLEQSPTYRKDAFERPWIAEDRARVLAHAGESGAALDVIERLLEKPSFLSVHTLRLDPRWDPIRDHPRFKALLAKHRVR
jgi:eukaryotic-like serine/threonine-protein kinase